MLDQANTSHDKKQRVNMTDTFNADNHDSVGSNEKFSDSTTKEKKSGVNLGFTTAFLFTVSLGML